MRLRRDESIESSVIAQVAGYLDPTELVEGWLVVFDLRKTVSWGEKVITKVTPQDGKTVHVIGC